MDRRVLLEQAVIKAALDLFGETGAGAFRLPVPNTTPPLFVVAGEDVAIREIGAPKND